MLLDLDLPPMQSPATMQDEGGRMERREPHSPPPLKKFIIFQVRNRFITRIGSSAFLDT
jgi:hypothetical protein